MTILTLECEAERMMVEQLNKTIKMLDGQLHFLPQVRYAHQTSVREVCGFQPIPTSFFRITSSFQSPAAVHWFAWQLSGLGVHRSYEIRLSSGKTLLHITRRRVIRRCIVILERVHFSMSFTCDIEIPATLFRLVARHGWLGWRVFSLMARARLWSAMAELYFR